MTGLACRVCKDGLFRYGMTRNDQIKLHESQDGKCRLCDEAVDLFVGHKGGFVDHDHKTDQVRGILCNRCNTVVGGIENHKDPKRLLEYLKLGV